MIQQVSGEEEEDPIQDQPVQVLFWVELKKQETCADILRRMKTSNSLNKFGACIKQVRSGDLLLEFEKAGKWMNGLWNLIASRLFGEVTSVSALG